MTIVGRKIFLCSDFIHDVDFIDINYGGYGFDDAPIITASLPGHNVNIFASDVTRISARLNFSTKVTGVVTYIITESG